jgi:ATP-dependent RNA helicase DDX46/PRP5
MDPDDREYSIHDFRKGIRGINVMVATSICARGLDIPDIVLVINFQCPNHMEDYIHRVGRTGRAGHQGTAITFVTQQEDHMAPDLVKALTLSGLPIPDDLRGLH